MTPGDEELVASARQGDRRAFEELVERHKRRAYHIAFDFTRDREEAKDLSQEAFLKAFTNLKNFDGRSSFYTWFYRIVVNLCLDYKRRQKRGPASSFDETIENQMEPSHEPVAAILAVVTRGHTPDGKFVRPDRCEEVEQLPTRMQRRVVGGKWAILGGCFGRHNLLIN